MVFTQTALEALQDTSTDGCLVITCTDIPHAKSVIHHAYPWILCFKVVEEAHLCIFFIALFQEMYQTTQPFDPEGVLGTVNSIVMGFLGMQVK